MNIKIKIVDVSADALAAKNRSGGSAMSSSTINYRLSLLNYKVNAFNSLIVYKRRIKKLRS